MNRKIIAFIPTYNEKSLLLNKKIKENISCQIISIDNKPDYILNIGTYYSPKYVDEEFKYLLGIQILALEKGANTIIINNNNINNKLASVMYKEKLTELGYTFNYIEVENICNPKTIIKFRKLGIKFKYLNYLYSTLKENINIKLFTKNNSNNNKVLLVGKFNAINKPKFNKIKNILYKYNLEIIPVNTKFNILTIKHRKNIIKRYLKYPINIDIVNYIYQILLYLENDGKYIIYLNNEEIINVNLIPILKHIEKNYNVKILITNNLENISEILSYIQQ